MRPQMMLPLMLLTGIAVTEPTHVGPVTLDRSEQYLIESKAVADTFRLDVVLPIGYAESEDRYPVVYVTDSNYLLTSAAATQLAQVTDELPDLILVGIGYDVPGIPDTAQIRVRDFSPTCDERYVESASLPPRLCGGADDFIEFIQDELKPFINGKYRTSQDATLVGYSFGGLFALHVLFTRNAVFDRYLIGSPSIDWDGDLMFTEEGAYAKDHTDLSKRVYLAAGGLEGGGTIPNAYRLYEQLLSRNYPGLKIELEILAGETHMTGINATVMRGLRSLFANP
ncbi:MAG: alpha/beta hydrolase-fold protein [Gammaproteobacteria bacterium]|nr:alpha/beta hydrolase-fold protein [Gammaproteobacteria bacterium]